MEIPKRGDDGITLRAGFIAKVLSMKKRNDLHTFQGLSWMKKKNDHLEYILRRFWSI